MCWWLGTVSLTSNLSFLQLKTQAEWLSRLLVALCLPPLHRVEGWPHDVFFFFFFLHCRTSARWSVNNGNEPVIEIKFPQKKETNNQPNKNNKTSNTHTQAKARARQNSQGNLQTK